MPPRFCLALLTAAALFGQATITPRARPPQQNEPPRLPRANIRVDANLALIPVTVLDPLGRMITGLGADNFQILEDGIPQKITSFGTEDSPISVGIVLDTSASMGNLAVSKQTVAEFFKLANPEDEAFLVELRDRPELVLPFTHNLDLIEQSVQHLKGKSFRILSPVDFSKALAAIRR